MSLFLCNAAKVSAPDIINAVLLRSVLELRQETLKLIWVS